MGRAYPVISCILFFASIVCAQQKYEPVAKFPLWKSPLKITETATPNRPFSVAGERGAILGQQDGTFELWSFPYKLLQHTHITAELDGYGVPIDLNQEASTIEVSPDRTTITYSHHAITVKQEMFALRGGAEGDPGAVVLFSIDAVKPGTLTFQFEPVMAAMWPAPQHGKPGASWIQIGTGGGFVLATDNPRLFGIVAMPNATSGVLAPYQERPQAHPLEFKIRFDPRTDRGKFFPLIALVGDGRVAMGAEAQKVLVERVVGAEDRIREIYEQTRAHYERFFDNRLTVKTPDPSFDEALQWAELSIDQSQVRFHGETGLVAGWYTSADSLRPGYGWFFGRDTLWTLYAIDSYGDSALARNALGFLMNRQREDGKIMHEFSQSADQVDWKSYPYMYAAADSTPLFVMVMEDYVRSTGDFRFLREHWENVQRAYNFTRAHDTNGIYDNSQGTGWVESWPPGMPHQELYLAALDEQSAEAYSRLAGLMNQAAESSAAKKVADSIRPKLADFRGPDGMYAFSRNNDGSYDRTPTIFPSVVWWTGRLGLPDADVTLSRWASEEFFTDWGLRAMSDRSPLYDPISYHQGSVWPLFTGWSSLAEYRAGHPLAGYEQLTSNEQLTWLQDVGAVTELLSGDYYAPLGRSSSHQMWSSAMVLSPAVRGLFGIEPDVLHHRLRLRPNLPATWDFANLDHVPYGDSQLAVSFTRKGSDLGVLVRSSTPVVLCIDTQPSFNDTECKSSPSAAHAATIKLPGVEIGLAREELLAGDRTHAVKVLEELYA
ncbi:MAG TPA: glycogen debranching protein, partial [Terriglobales bacterium]|nr:glycogen debranching protein [Terriglobales bacterium]